MPKENKNAHLRELLDRVRNMTTEEYEKLYEEYEEYEKENGPFPEIIIDPDPEITKLINENFMELLDDKEADEE